MGRASTWCAQQSDGGAPSATAVFADAAAARRTRAASRLRACALAGQLRASCRASASRGRGLPENAPSMHAPSRSSRSAVHVAALGPPLARPPKLPLHESVLPVGVSCCVPSARSVLPAVGGRSSLEAQREGELRRGHHDLQTVLLDPAGVHEDSGVVQAQPAELGHELFRVCGGRRGRAPAASERPAAPRYRRRRSRRVRQSDRHTGAPHL